MSPNCPECPGMDRMKSSRSSRFFLSLKIIFIGFLLIGGMKAAGVTPLSIKNIISCAFFDAEERLPHTQISLFPAKGNPFSFEATIPSQFYRVEILGLDVKKGDVLEFEISAQDVYVVPGRHYGRNPVGRKEGNGVYGIFYLFTPADRFDFNDPEVISYQGKTRIAVHHPLSRLVFFFPQGDLSRVSREEYKYNKGNYSLVLTRIPKMGEKKVGNPISEIQDVSILNKMTAEVRRCEKEVFELLKKGAKAEARDRIRYCEDSLLEYIPLVGEKQVGELRRELLLLKGLTAGKNVAAEKP